MVLAGCGQSSSGRTPELARVPLVPGARVVTSVQRCDRGANPYCAYQVVVADSRFATSTALLQGEVKRLHAAGWSSANADIGNEHSADSPGHKLRLTYATAALDLEAIDLGWVRRAGSITRALSRTMFDRA